MSKRTRKETMEWIIQAFLALLSRKSYSEITIIDIALEAHIGRRTFYRHFKSKEEVLLAYCQSIMKDFAAFIRMKEEITLYSVSLSYFEFCHKHIDFLVLLQESDMLHFIGDRLPEFLADVAIMVEHVSPQEVMETYEKQDLYYYVHYFNMGGYWNITKLWLQKKDRKTPQEMADMIVKIMNRDY